MTKTDVRTEIVGSVATREMHFEARHIDEDARTVELAFSSEEPVLRYWGYEILDHSPGSVRMDKLRDGAPLLLDHNSSKQIGVIESARIDSDKLGRAIVRFSRGPLGDEIFNDVRDRIRTKVSVGYIVHAMRLEESGDEVEEVYRIYDWEPIETSVVAIGADTSVGVGRSSIQSDSTSTASAFDLKRDTEMPDEMPDEMLNDEGNLQQRAAPDNDNAAPGNAAPDNDNAAPGSGDEHGRTEVLSINPDAENIRVIARHFGMRDLGEDMIHLGSTLAQFREAVRQQRPDPIPAVPRIEARIPHAGKLRAFRHDLYDGGRREAEEAAYRAGQFCRAVIFSDAGALRWCRDHSVQVAVAGGDMRMLRALTGVGTGQSVLVPDELVLPIINLREEYGVARRYCQNHPMLSDTASVPRRASGATAYFVGREDAVTASDPGLDNVNLTAKNVAAETRVSNDYAEDSVINLADFVATEHALAFATKEDNCLFNGDGTSTYGGIIGIRTAILSLAGAVDAASGHDTFLEIDSADLDGVVGALPEIPGIMPSWFSSKRGESLMFGRLRTAAGGNTKRDMAERVPKQWDGDDIVISQAMPKGTGATDYSDVAMAIYGDLNLGVVFGDRRGMTMLTDPFSLSSYQQTKIIHSERFDINAHGVGNASVAGPVVALIGE